MENINIAEIVAENYNMTLLVYEIKSGIICSFPLKIDIGNNSIGLFMMDVDNLILKMTKDS